MDSPKGLPLDVVKIIIHDGIVMPYRVCFGKKYGGLGTTDVFECERA